MDNQDLTEKQLSTSNVYDGRLLHVREDQVALPNGNTATREYIVHPGAVVVVPLLDNGDVLMVRQFRYPLNREFHELPAGKIDPGEDVLACGQRELLEETGYAAQDWKFLTTIHPCIGYSDERILIYLAQGLERARPPARRGRVPGERPVAAGHSIGMGARRAHQRRENHHRPVLGREDTAGDMAGRQIRIRALISPGS